MRLCSLFCILLLFVAGCGKKNVEKPVSYRSDIQPILNKHCIQCHGIKRVNRRILLTSYVDVMNSTTKPPKTPIVIPNKVTKSWLYLLAATKQPHYRMPPDTSTFQPVPEDEVKLIAQWIEEGAKHN